MKNKKKIITILLATILAFIAVLFIFRTEHKKSEQVTPEQKIEEQNGNLNEYKIKSEKEEEQAVNQRVQDSIKVQENKTNIKQAIKPTTKKGTVKIPVRKQTEETAPIQGETTKVEESVNSDELEKEVIVPVKYVTRNTYRYVYTPAKFKKK